MITLIDEAQTKRKLSHPNLIQCFFWLIISNNCLIFLRNHITESNRSFREQMLQNYWYFLWSATSFFALIQLEIANKKRSKNDSIKFSISSQFVKWPSDGKKVVLFVLVRHALIQKEFLLGFDVKKYSSEGNLLFFHYSNIYVFF